MFRYVTLIIFSTEYIVIFVVSSSYDFYIYVEKKLEKLLFVNEFYTVEKGWGSTEIIFHFYHACSS